MTDFSIEKPTADALDAAEDTLEYCEDWGLTEQIQMMMFRDSTVTLEIHEAHFVVDETKSGWRMGPGSFPGIREPMWFLIQGAWHFNYTATYDGLGSFKGSGTWDFAAELGADTYPEVWQHCPFAGNKTHAPAVSRTT